LKLLARADGVLALGLFGLLLGSARAEPVAHARSKERPHAPRSVAPLTRLAPSTFEAPVASNPVEPPPAGNSADKSVHIGDVTITPGGFVAIERSRSD
jgi:hypothetical protein